MAFDATIQLDACSDCHACNECLGKQFSNVACGSVSSSIVKLTQGQHLFRAGDSVSCVYVLRSGALKTYITSSDGEEQILAFYSAGDVVGLDSMSGGRHTRNTLTLSPSEICRLPIESLIQASGRSNSLRSCLLEGMGREIQRLQSMLRLERMAAEQRVVFFLLNQARRQARGLRVETRRTVQLPMSRGEIGRFLDLATETVSRCLTRLQAGGAIRISRNEIELLDVAALLRIAQSPGSDEKKLAA